MAARRGQAPRRGPCRRRGGVRRARKEKGKRGEEGPGRAGPYLVELLAHVGVDVDVVHAVRHDPARPRLGLPPAAPGSAAAAGRGEGVRGVTSELGGGTSGGRRFSGGRPAPPAPSGPPWGRGKADRTRLAPGCCLGLRPRAPPFPLRALAGPRREVRGPPSDPGTRSTMRLTLCAVRRVVRCMWCCSSENKAAF